MRTPDITKVRNTVSHPRVAGNVLKMQARKCGTRDSVGAVATARFDSVLGAIADDHDNVFVHAGLSDVNTAFDGNPYDVLFTHLTRHFESVLVPGFTPSFKDTGIYHKQYSQPEFGAFARLFLSDAEYRTDDPIHSIMVKGPYRFPECDQTNTFCESGCWAKFDDENMLYLNVGTDWLRSTQLHYLEQQYDVPYVDIETYDGVIYRDETTFEDRTQRNHDDTLIREFNRPKLERELVATGTIESTDLEGLQLRWFGATALRRALDPSLRRDPYYLIT